MRVLSIIPLVSLQKQQWVAYVAHLSKTSHQNANKVVPSLSFLAMVQCTIFQIATTHKQLHTVEIACSLVCNKLSDQRRMLLPDRFIHVFTLLRVCQASMTKTSNFGLM